MDHVVEMKSNAKDVFGVTHRKGDPLHAPLHEHPARRLFFKMRRKQRAPMRNSLRKLESMETNRREPLQLTNILIQ